MERIKTIDGQLVGVKYKPGIRFDYRIAVPCVKVESYALIVDHDGQNDANVQALLELADKGVVPYTVSVGVGVGRLQMSDGSERGMRMNCYDLFDREYGDFIVFELIPHIEKEYGLKIDQSPERHIVSGGSSGGISAFVIAWFHPDYFRRIYMSSPSFLAMGRGNEIPYLIRKFETKPFRIYMEYSENEPNDYFGWSRPIDEETAAALEYAGYDHAVKYFPGEGHCSRYRDENEAKTRLLWLMSERRSPENSPRVGRIVPSASYWEACDRFPEKNGIALENAPDDHDIAVYSSDKLAIYCANHDEDTVYIHSVGNNGRLPHVLLHTFPTVYPIGAIDMAVDKGDRLFVLTAIGIQCVRSFGIVDSILDLPYGRPSEIAVSDALYVKTSTGIYKRALTDECTKNGALRRTVDYYD